MTDTRDIAREAIELAVMRAKNWLANTPDRNCQCNWCYDARSLLELRKENEELSAAIESWKRAEESWTAIRAGIESELASLRERCEGYRVALRECQGVLASLVSADKTVSGIAIETAYANCVAAEAKARATLTKDQDKGDVDGKPIPHPGEQTTLIAGEAHPSTIDEEIIDIIADGNRPLPFDRDTLGRFVREAWVRWAKTQPNAKPSWLLPYDELSEADKEADRQIGEAVARWTLIGDAAAGTMMERSHPTSKESAGGGE